MIVLVLQGYLCEWEDRWTISATPKKRTIDQYDDDAVDVWRTIYESGIGGSVDFFLQAQGAQPLQAQGELSLYWGTWGDEWGGDTPGRIVVGELDVSDAFYDFNFADAPIIIRVVGERAPLRCPWEGVEYVSPEERERKQ